MNRESNYNRPDWKATPETRMVAVIDIGASSVRMQIAEINQKSGDIRKLESYSQAVSVGKDSFAKGYIDKHSIEDCVRVMQIYRAKLAEYGVVDPEAIRVIATSGVREAANRLAFIDRIFVASGFEIEPFDEAELHRVTYFGMLPFIQKRSKDFGGQSIIFEPGGGTAELLMLDKSDVVFSRNYRLGSLRLRNTLELYDAPLAKSRSLMENQILQTIDEFKASAGNPTPENFIAMGGDIRFAANEINQKLVGDELVEVKLKALEKFTDQILSQTSDHTATKYHMSLPDANSLGPNLLTQLLFARELGCQKFLVANVNLRDGLLKEMAQGRIWPESIQAQIVQSAMRLGRKYRFNEKHAVHVAQLACSLFDQLKTLHKLPVRFRGFLQLASLLHEIGSFVSAKSKHKHSLYLILNSDLFGVGTQDLKLIALVARYHRGATPQPRHDGYGQLEREQRVVVSKLAAILRIAKALDVGHHQRIETVRCLSQGNRMELSTPDVADLSMEQLELRQVSGMFEDIFGSQVLLETVGEA
jgi:exopolyphosphatase/guanosine-5'-triphosphate,3'-diphosphate pyrophosphatase